MNDKLLRNFMHDTRTFLDRLGSQLLQLEKEPENSEILDQCFRTAHSLKSEASYMDYEGMTRTAHNLECIFEELSDGSRELSSELMEEMLSLTDSLEEQNEIIISGYKDVPEIPIEEGTSGEEIPVSAQSGEILVDVDSNGDAGDIETADDAVETVDDGETLYDEVTLDDEAAAKIVDAGDNENPVESIVEDEIPKESDNVSEEPAGHAPEGIFNLNEFQMSILDDAKNRGELFYRLICELDPDLPMKYAKAYLLVNNLELIVNVVNVSPSMDDEEADFSEINILLTSSVSEGEIFRAVNVDQVSRIQLTGLRYGDSYSGCADNNENTSEKTPTADTKTDIEDSGTEKELRVDSRILDRLAGNMEEMRFLVHRVPEIRGDGLKLIKEMEKILAEIRMIPAGELMGGFARLVRDLGKKAGKEIEFTLEGADIPLDRRMTQVLIEPLTHLIRNSIDHGIEFASERQDAGKEPTGQIEIEVRKEGRDVMIVLSDDGKGIRRTEILERAEEMGLYTGDEKDLLHYLIQPGFSTVKEATPMSGRGMGLDLINRTVKQNAGGKLSLLTKEGEGTSFIIKMPREYNPVKLVLFRSGGKIFAASTRERVEIMEVEAEDFSKDGSGGMFLDGVPVYSVNGRLFMTGQPPREKMAVKVSNLGREAWLLIQELLFEQDLPEEQIVLGKEISPHHFEVTTGGRKADYIYLNPSLFVS